MVILAADHTLNELPLLTSVEDACERLSQAQDALEYIDDIVLICCHSLNNGTERRCTDILDTIFKQDTTNQVLLQLIEVVKPLLPNVTRPQNDKHKGLNPQLGFTLAEDEQRIKWRQSGGLQSIPLLHTIVKYLPRDQVSANMWWITPGLLNLLDDTTDLYKIKIPTLTVLRTFLQNCFKKDDKWIQFKDTGLFELLETLLLNLSYSLPPAYEPKDTLAIYKELIPTINVLYSQRFDEELQKRHLRKFLSSILLSNVLHRIAFKDEDLTVFVINTITDIVKCLGNSAVVTLQRLIYCIGEYIVKNAFFTTFQQIVNSTINLVDQTVQTCPQERVMAHRYDFSALIIIIYEKSEYEGTLTNDTLERLKKLINILKDDSLTKLSKERDLKKLFD